MPKSRQLVSPPYEKSQHTRDFSRTVYARTCDTSREAERRLGAWPRVQLNGQLRPRSRRSVSQDNDMAASAWVHALCLSHGFHRADANSPSRLKSRPSKSQDNTFHSSDVSLCTSEPRLSLCSDFEREAWSRSAYIPGPRVVSSGSSTHIQSLSTTGKHNQELPDSHRFDPHAFLTPKKRKERVTAGQPSKPTQWHHKHHKTHSKLTQTTQTRPQSPSGISKATKTKTTNAKIDRHLKVLTTVQMTSADLELRRQEESPAHQKAPNPASSTPAPLPPRRGSEDGSDDGSRCFIRYCRRHSWRRLAVHTHTVGHGVQKRLWEVRYFCRACRKVVPERCFGERVRGERCPGRRRW